MVASSLFLGLLGLSATFLPQEILSLLEQEATVTLALLTQLMGALYLGFAILNWMAKTVLIGGIYAKPLSQGNFCHFVIGAITLWKHAFDTPSIALWVVAGLYAIFAITFGTISFTHPKLKS
jgi:hypothetical protein